MTDRQYVHFHSGNIYGGIERILSSVARRGRHHRFHLCYDDTPAAELRALGATVTIGPPVRFGRPWTLPAARRALHDALLANPPQAVLCHSPWSVAVGARAILRARRPLVVWIHGAVSGRHWLERLAGRATPERIFTNSRFTAEQANRLFPGVDPTVIYPPVEDPNVEADRAASIRADLGIAEGQVMIVQVGRIEPGKGLDLHVRALAALRDDPRWVLCVVGSAATRHDARHLQQIRDEARHLGIDRRVLFLGPRRDVPAILSVANIYCQPNVAPEGFGITFVEAMRAGLPVVTTRLGAAPEIVDETCGALVEPNAHDLAGTMRELIGNADRLRALGAGGPERARRLCDPSRQVAKLDAALAHVSA